MRDGHSPVRDVCCFLAGAFFSSLLVLRVLKLKLCSFRKGQRSNPWDRGGEEGDSGQNLTRTRKRAGPRIGYADREPEPAWRRDERRLCCCLTASSCREAALLGVVRWVPAGERFDGSVSTSEFEFDVVMQAVLLPPAGTVEGAGVAGRLAGSDHTAPAAGGNATGGFVGDVLTYRT